MTDIHPQYTFDNAGNAVGVFLPIDDWNSIMEELNMELPQWQKDFIDSRLDSYRKNPSALIEWETVMSEFEKEDEAE